MRFASILLLFIFFSAPGQAPGSIPQTKWNQWSAESFARAKAGNKPVFLYLEAVWCHWCHVMQARTFSDPEVAKRLARDFVAIKVDHDADPGLANRYRDYGWPALVFLSADGVDLVKRAGFIAPDDFNRLLAAVTADPTPEPQSAAAPKVPSGPSQLSAASRAYLLRRHEQSFDAELGGLRTAQKFMDRDSTEYALTHAASLTAERQKAIKTLDAARALIDPVWGGVYQYSTGGTWQNAHFEKIMRVQAGYLRLYALAYQNLGEKQYLIAAQRIKGYLFNFLRSPDGAFYVSQDADVVQGQKAAAYFVLGDAARRDIGMPRIDKSIYADANALAIDALALLYSASGDQTALDAAVDAARYTLKHRRGDNSLMRHGQEQDAAAHLSDSLFMARAMLSLYEISGQRQWMMVALQLGRAVNEYFRLPDAGFVTELAQPGVPVVPRPFLAENIVAARFFNQLFHYSGDARFSAAAEHAMKYLAGYAEMETAFEEAGILLADDELRRDPAHLTVVGPKSDETARDLFRTALRVPASYRRVEWLDRDEGDLPNSDVTYPDFSKPAGYVCTDGRCSRPSFDVPEYAEQIRRLLQ